MNKEIREIIDKYKYDKKLSSYSHKYFFDDNSIWSSINNNDDVERAYNFVNNSINTYKKIYPLVFEDITELEKALGKYEIAVKKVLNCFDNPNCNFVYSADELQQLVDNDSDFEERISKIRMRKACQD